MSDALIFRGLFLAWQAATDAYNASAAPDGAPEAETLLRRARDLEAYAAQRPAETLEALAFKVLIADDGGDMGNAPGQRALVAEARAVACRMERGEPGTILRLYHDRAALRAAAQDFPVAEGLDEDAECDALFWNRCDELQRQMEALPAVTAADFAAKAISVTCDGSLCLDWGADPLWQEARRLVGEGAAA